MQQIVQILMERDGMSETDAVDEYNFAKQEIASLLCSGDTDAVEDFLMEELGLESDYIFNFI